MHVCTEAYPCLLSFKAQGFPQIERGGRGGRCLAGCHVVVRTLAGMAGMHLVRALAGMHLG